MWEETFRELSRSQQTLAGVVLKGLIPLSSNGTKVSSSCVERASAILATRLPLEAKTGDRRRLVFLLPNATQSLGRSLAVHLLLADFVHRQGRGSEQGPLLNGDLLLVTQHIRECVGLLRGLSIRYGTESLPITKFWPIEVLSQYSPPIDSKPRVFVANPGWASTLSTSRSFGSVVIDLSHPRTSEHLDRILGQSAIANSQVQILVTPPCEPERLKRLRDDGRDSCLAWAWDPSARTMIEEVLSSSHSVHVPTKPLDDRCRWIIEDSDVNDRLANLHSLLAGAMKAANGRVPGHVLSAWAIYHRFRQLAVPLVRLEEARSKGYRTLSLCDRIAELETADANPGGALGAYLDAQWPRVVDLLKETYQVLLHLQEPNKFYGLAAAIEHLLVSNEAERRPIRIVAPTRDEGSMLALLLNDIVTAWPKALAAGRVSLTTVREEPRLIAEGRTETTVLLGFRTSESRFLDVYPGVPLNVISYPYEAEVDEAIQRRVYSSIEPFEQHHQRTAVLQKLRLPVRERTVARPIDLLSTNGHQKRPRSTERFQGRKLTSNERHFLNDDAVEPINIGHFAGFGWTDEVLVEQDEATATGSHRPQRVQYVEVTDTLGDRLRFPGSRLVDVFYPATETKERIPAKSLQSGMQIIVLVDDPYEDVFQRLLEAIAEQRDLQASMALDLWQHAKQIAFTKYRGNLRRLFEGLSEQNLSVDYSAVVGWYAEGEREILAPRDEADFRILAGVSGLYTEDGPIRATFEAIRRERNVRRQCGRTLSRLLAQIAAGQHYDAAVQSADAIGTPLEQFASAVTIREVEGVRVLGSLTQLSFA